MGEKMSIRYLLKVVENETKFRVFSYGKKKILERIGGRDGEIVEIKWWKFYVEKSIGIMILSFQLRHNSLNFIIGWINLFFCYQFDYLKNLQNIYPLLFAIRI